jgi:large subunit ribosomal protein L35
MLTIVPDNSRQNLMISHWSTIMPKMKTNKAAARRFKITGTGKILRKQSGKRHINEWMSPGVKRNLRGWAPLEKSQHDNVMELFPYPKYLR